MKDVAKRDRGTTTTRITSYVLIVFLAQFCGGVAKATPLQEEQHCLALSLYWEARGDGRRGMVAVGWTVLNRIYSSQFPATPCEVVHQGGEKPPCQFSWWCDGKSDRPRERYSWHLALITAGELLQDPPPDPTGGSLYFHSTNIRTPWDRSRIRTAQIGSHVFYR